MRERLVIFSLLVVCTAFSLPSAHGLDTSKIDAKLGRPGAWIEGNYVVDFFRPDVPVTLQGVRLAAGQVDSFASFTGKDDNAEMMGEVCALASEVTAVVERLRASGVGITGIHNHFVGESPRLIFIHFMAHGSAPKLASAFRSALGATTTPLGNAPAPKTSAAPEWTETVARTIGREGSFSADYGWLDIEFPHAAFPAGPMDFWRATVLFFQEAPGGKVAATGDLAVTAGELDRAVSVLTEQKFQVMAVHNHMTDDEPQLFFVHFWKVGAPADVANGLKRAVAVIKTR
jgi:hypothetical protein